MTVFLLLAAVVAWQLGDPAVTNLAAMRPLAWGLVLAFRGVDLHQLDILLRGTAGFIVHHHGGVDRGGGGLERERAGSAPSRYASSRDRANAFTVRGAFVNLVIRLEHAARIGVLAVDLFGAIAVRLRKGPQRLFLGKHIADAALLWQGIEIEVQPVRTVCLSWFPSWVSASLPQGNIAAPRAGRTGHSRARCARGAVVLLSVQPHAPRRPAHAL